MKRTKKQIRHLSQKNEVERLKEELAKKNQELYDTRLERDILKKSLTLFGPSKPDTNNGPDQGRPIIVTQKTAF